MTQEALFEQLKHPNPHLRERAMWELVDTRDDQTIPHLMSVLDEEDTTYRRAAVKTLGAIGIDTVPLLLESLSNSKNATVRSSCAKALAQVAINYPDEPFPPEGIEGLNTALNDWNPVVNLASAMALGVIGVPALDGLIETLNATDNPALAVAVVNAISSIKDPRSSEVLAQLANDESADTYVREMANSALSRLELVNSQLTRN